ncbi:MAG: small acid-soluble spore protein SspI [Bacillota bacterium]|nr:MAG: small acid-soluble spore protein SspI [Bacillota bacterium]
MASLDIRELVLKNLAGSKREEVEEYIDDAIQTREEQALPGMGILFEVVWQRSNDTEKASMMDKIMAALESV